MNSPGLRAVCIAVPLLSFVSPAAHAQLIPIKTIPIAQGNQFEIFPSSNLAMADVSIALPDSIGDPFVNPATTARLRGSRLFATPTVYSVSGNAGGGRSLPFALLAHRGDWFGGFALTLQQVEPSRSPQPFGGPVALESQPPPGGNSVIPLLPTGNTARSHGNGYAFGMIGRKFSAKNLSLGASVTWTSLHALDGVDLLYEGSRSITQTGNALDLRVGALKEWPGERGARALEAIVVHNRFSTTHDVLFADVIWDPNVQTFREQARVDTNYDRTTTWGAQLQYQIPLATPGWRIAWLATANRSTHPKGPVYGIGNVGVLPQDPGHSSAYNLGIGVSKVLGPSRFGVDAIFEPIRSYTWADATAPMPTLNGDTLALGAKMLENRFSFANALLRIGVGREMDLEGTNNKLGMQLGLALRSISYRLEQTDHIQLTERAFERGWVEWTPTWGLSLRFPELDIRYQGRVTKGAGRPNANSFFVGQRDIALSGGMFLATPNGPLILTDVSTTTHQISLSLPLR